MSLLDLIFPPREDEARLRALDASAFTAKVSARLASATRPGAVVLLTLEDPVVRAAIHEAKYHGSRHAFILLSEALAAYLVDAEVELAFARLVPVPLGRERHRERGFNQVEEVARRAGHALRIPLAGGLLERTRETPSQVSLARREREENMRGAFGAAHSADPTYLYIVIDDVLTTGATLQAAIDALAAAGATTILPIALAH